MQNTGNHLLDSLSGPLREEVLRGAQRVRLRANREVFASATPTNLVFLTAGAVSITLKMQDGTIPEVGFMGREGLLGYQLLFGSHLLTNGYLMHGEGTGIIVPCQQLKRLVAENGELSMRIDELAAIQTRISMQLTACSVEHEADQRLARWLLSTSSLLGTSDITITQETLSLLLGLRRTTISLISTKFEGRAITRTRRGMVTVVHRHELALQSCECYHALSVLKARDKAGHS